MAHWGVFGVYLVHPGIGPKPSRGRSYEEAFLAVVLELTKLLQVGRKDVQVNAVLDTFAKAVV